MMADLAAQQCQPFATHLLIYIKVISMQMEII